MRIIVDNEIADITLDTERTLGDVITALDEWVGAAGLMICEIQVDGTRLDGEEVASVFKREIDVTGELAICTAPLNPKDALFSMEEEIELLCERLCDYALNIQIGQARKANDTVFSFSELSSKLLTLLRVLQDNVGDYTRLGLEENFAEEFYSVLKEFFSAIQDGDTVLSGDLAEYELAPRLKYLYSALKAHSQSL
ncbi:MAG: hypothetical protein LBC77_02975 [Spirochaetaceae bacterium]|nr:hypothetical protein [Spirochaetaceae bacterium]